MGNGISMEFLSFLPNIVICVGGIAVTVYAVIEKSGGTYFLKRIVSWPKCLEFFGGIAVTVGSLILAVQQNRFEHQIISMITGGESYCYMQFLNYQDVNDTVDLLFKCDGDYPVYDVGVRIDNVQKIAAAVEQIIKV